MKTTGNLKGELLRRAKARAALRGQPLARYMEECLEQRLEQDESQAGSLGQWIDSLPKVSAAAVADLEKSLASEDFRQVDEEMWQCSSTPMRFPPWRRRRPA